MKVNIVNHTKFRLEYKELQSLIEKICIYFLANKIRNRAQLNIKKEITLVFLSIKEMKKINKQFRRKNKPTDILSFSSTDKKSFGELLLCLDILKKQAAEQGHSLKKETTYMLIHGILHLLGYDHEISLQEEVLMFRLQDTCFAELVRLEKT